MKVLVVDDHPSTRVGIRTILESEEDVHAISEAGESDEALRLTRRDNKPDVVVLGLELEGPEGGIELCHNLKSLPAPPGVVIHGTRVSNEALFLCKLYGANSYVNKSEETPRLVEAVRAANVGRGLWIFGHEEGAGSRFWEASLGKMSLTPREREVFALLLKRYTNAQIANELSISPRTARNHAYNVLRKLNVARRTDLPLDTWQHRYR